MIICGFSPWLPATVLSGYSTLQEMSKALPPTTNHPQEIQCSQTAGLREMATISVLMYGSSMDVKTVPKIKAEAAKADYYVIIMIDDIMIPGQ